MTKGIESDSRKVLPGFTFVAIRGITHDGHNFIKEALNNGATKIVGEKNRPSWLPDRIEYLEVNDSREALGKLASDFYDNPSKKLTLIGVTGTKGKTTTAHLIYHILTSLGQKVGLVSSISVPGLHVTTPDVVLFHKMLKQMVDKGCKYAVIEVSSHGIDQKRIAGAKFDVGVLTNIASEHLDYHKNFSEYKNAKMSFINSTKIKIYAPKTTKLNILPGEFNNLNAEAALKTVKALGFNFKKAKVSVCSFELPEGRLQEIKNSLGIKIIIDFAHTPDSLNAVLTHLKEVTKNKLIVVFGCAGERDSKKRSKMGRISTQIADLSIFTAEDPRSERVFDILKTMKSKALKGTFVEIAERAEAIAYGLSIVKKGDTLAVLGKGHEKSMAYKGYEHPWSDKELIMSLLNAKDNTAVIVLAAGKGTRMKNSKPKVLREICARPMISYTLESLRKAGFSEIVVVVSYKKDVVLRRVKGAIKAAVQKNSKGGTADAAKAGLFEVSKNATTVVVINGDDSAFYKPDTINEVVETHCKTKSSLTFVSLEKDNPHGLGRVVRDNKGNLLTIVEEKDATDTQRKIKEINDGLYVFKRKWLEANIKKVKLSPQGEYYLVDLVKIALSQKEKVVVYKLKDSNQWQGINTPEQLLEAQKKMKKRLGYE
ncbi:Mur ligase family protein [Patescibacteria group bacterium]